MPTKKILIILAFALNIGLTIIGFATLLESPYTGIRMSVCGDHACVKSVDRDSPAYGKVQTDDRLVDVAGQNISYLAFNVDVDYIQSELDHEIFWESLRKVDDVVVKGRQVELSLERGGKRLTFFVTPIQFPAWNALFRTIPLYFVGWTFQIIAYLIWRKKVNAISIAFLILGFSLCANLAATTPFGIRDIAYPCLIFRLASSLDLFAVLVISISNLHLILVFPRSKRIVSNYPWLIHALYGLIPVLFVLRLIKAFDNTQLTAYLPLSISGVIGFSVLVVNFFNEKSAVLRRQIKWLVFGILSSTMVYIGLTSIPMMFGAPIVSAELSVLPTALFPLSFAFAITKYKLMAIDNIIDTAVVYGFTILILAGVETTFLSFASPYLLTAGKGLPAFSVVAVLLIVFIYVPIRNIVKGVVERLFKRGKYDPEKELQQFTVSLGLCDERSALEKFTVFVKGLLRPSGIVVLKIGDRTATILHADSEGAQNQVTAVLAKADAAWEVVGNKGTCAFGYEFSEKVGGEYTLFTPDLENALFVPFITDQDNMTSGYLAVLLKKWNETAYSVKDVTLLNAISVNIANIIEAGELRKERAYIEERFRKEKDAVMKELHDGLGNILTSVTITSQAAGRMLEKDESKAKELVGRISEFSTEAMNFMRTGLTLLDNPHREIGTIMEAVRDRFGEMFESSGMELKIELDDDAGRIRPGAMMAMNLTRVIQEALNNVMKHSAAKSVRIRMEQRGAGLAVTLSDNGKGFQVGDKTSGFGIESMKRRVEEMKGNLRIDSSPGKGTEIRFTVFAG